MLVVSHSCEPRLAGAAFAPGEARLRSLSLARPPGLIVAQSPHDRDVFGCEAKRQQARIVDVHQPRHTRSLTGSSRA
jgi:hypothetical protein